jgi:predicted exporter
MSFREKIARLSFIAMVVTFGPYFTLIGMGILPQRPLPDLRQLGLFAIVTVIRMLILGAGYLYFRHASPQEARTPPDERDRAIESRSISSAYYVLMFGMIAVGCVMPFHSAGWAIVNGTLFTIVAAELVHYGVIVYCYRRQA